jgi:hypothetical protein
MGIYRTSSRWEISKISKRNPRAVVSFSAQTLMPRYRSVTSVGCLVIFVLFFTDRPRYRSADLGMTLRFFRVFLVVLPASLNPLLSLCPCLDPSVPELPLRHNPSARIVLPQLVSFALFLLSCFGTEVGASAGCFGRRSSVFTPSLGSWVLVLAWFLPHFFSFQKLRY